MTIESEIIAWALERPGWQQDVLVALSDGDAYGTDSIRRLVDEILSGTNRVPSQEAKKISAKSAVVEQVELTAIADLRGVNALADDQRLEFAKNGLTVVYGDNGSGKSGYARLIKAMVSSRHSSEILPNVFREATENPSGSLLFRVAGQDRQLTFPTSPPPELLKMSFYDEHCGDQYLTKESEITYRPSALILLDGLIQVCDDVRIEIAAQTRSNEETALTLELPSTTTAGAFIAALTAVTTDAAVDAATSTAPGTNERLAAALREEVRLTSSDPQKEKTRLSTLCQQVKGLAEDLKGLLEELGTDKTSTRVRLRSIALSTREAATLAAANSFDEEPLAGVGSETWRALWNAARVYSTTEAYHEHDFPFTSEDAVCILCQQTLEGDAPERLRRFARYMANTTENDADTAERAYVSTLDQLRKLSVATPSRTTALTDLEAHDAELASSVVASLVTAEEQREAILRHLTTDESAPAPLPVDNLPEKLTTLAIELQEQVDTIDVTQFNASLEAATKEKVELQASVRLSESKAKVKAEIRRLQALKALKSAGTEAATTSITQKSSSLTREYATEKILDQFTSETERLRLQKVTLEDRGARKGQLNQRPGLLGATKGVSARQVLSEGEQTALGLAGFFTETVFDESKSAIIFDDPVTSLDHVRRGKVAERLAQLAQDRQVVVFTHDVVFTGDLAAAAVSEGVTLTERSVERRGAEPGMCIDEFPWKAKYFDSRKQHLTAELAKITKDRPSLRQADYEERVASWAGHLSELWERSVTSEIMHQVFDRSTSQVRMLKFRMLAKITAADNQNLQDGYGATSKWGRRHDKAVETNYVAPEPADLQHELTRIIEWRKQVRKYLDTR